MKISEVKNELSIYPQDSVVLAKDKDSYIQCLGTVEDVLKMMNEGKIMKGFPVSRIGKIECTLSPTISEAFLEDKWDNIIVTILILQNDCAEDYSEEEDQKWLNNLTTFIEALNENKEIKNRENAVNFLITFLKKQ